jgi:hypothetical protein
MIKVDVKIKNNKYLMIEEYTLVRGRSHVFLVKLFAYSRGRDAGHLPRAVGWQQTSM